MAKVLDVMTVLIIALGMLQESTATTTTPPAMQMTGQDTTETHHSSSTASLTTHSTFLTNSPNTLTSTLNKTDRASSASPETSISLTATSSQSHTLSHGEINTTNPNNTTLVVSNSSGTTALRTTELASVITILSSPGEPAPSNKGQDSLARNPGLVAILCIFCIVLALVIVVAIAKLISCRKTSQFERLDDVPMSKIKEDAPFARYPSQ
ncbi:protein CIST1-like isoform X3 [Neoarius graeffei]|uniref:protein CIST1-like isoform X3 n=1 Tax=Neoarius graeffei TaxID=443677 RepID=UPI00298C2D37|nr:protein CIST1-like isoform X3 [Neoarius graeffei]